MRRNKNTIALYASATGITALFMLILHKLGFSQTSLLLLFVFIFILIIIMLMKMIILINKKEKGIRRILGISLEVIAAACLLLAAYGVFTG